MSKKTKTDSQFPLMSPQDPDGAARGTLQERLGLRPGPYDEDDTAALELRDECDAFAREILTRFDGMMAGVNLVLPGCQQYFIGLAKRDNLGEVEEADRNMGPEAGYCAVLITERLAPLAIKTADHPRWSTNIVAQEFGVTRYIGTELKTPSGEPFATIWCIDDKPDEENEGWHWQQADLDWMKAIGEKIETRVIERSGLQF